MVWRMEAGRADDVTLRQVDAVVRALSARLELHVSWQGEGLDRLLDADHATLVEAVATELRSLGWDVAVEVSFNIRGERGSIDLLAYHPSTETVLVVEVKSVVPDLQATLVVLDRKGRLAPEIAGSAAGGHARRAGSWSSRTAGPRGAASQSMRPSLRPPCPTERWPRSAGSAVQRRECRSRECGSWQLLVR